MSLTAPPAAGQGRGSRRLREGIPARSLSPTRPPVGDPAEKSQTLTWQLGVQVHNGEWAVVSPPTDERLLMHSAHA